MLVSLLGVANELQGLQIALARLLKHLAPQVVVGRVELAVETDGRGLGSAVDAVGQVVAVLRFLPSGLEHAYVGH
ncbi:hypothetical protein D3C86_2088530 [compost metagenome]